MLRALGPEGRGELIGGVTCSSRRWVDPANPVAVPPVPDESGLFCSLLGTRDTLDYSIPIRKPNFNFYIEFKM